MEQVSIVVVPIPAQGHLNQLLHFSLKLQLKLSSHGRRFSVHFAASESHNRQAKSRLQGWNSTSLETIHFHDLPLPPFPTPLPDPTTNGPNHLIPSFDAAMDLRAPLASLFRSLSPNTRRLVVIYDIMMAFVSADVAQLANGESYLFQCVPSFIELHYISHQQESPPPSHIKQTVNAVISIPTEGCITPETWEFISRRRLGDFASRESGTLFNTCRAVEGEFLDLYAQLPKSRGKKLFAVGPLNPLLAIDGGSGGAHACLEWLDEQPPGSVLYVAFGSTCTFTDGQIEQLGIGLRRSGQRFIWVLRDADLGDIFADENRRETRLPGFEEEVGGIGMVVRGWAPQLQILAHPSTGGFMSHCGWNSCMESLSMGVPMVAWPVHSDQPRNAIMVTEYLKAGIEVREWARHEEIVSSGEIEGSVKKLMVDEEGKEIKKRARLLGEAIRHSALEGGSSVAELDSFVAHISR